MSDKPTSADVRRPLSTSHWPVDTSPGLHDITVGDLLRRVAAEIPNREALVEGVSTNRRRWTYDQLLTESVALARSLLTRFEPGQRIALWAPNTPEWVLVQFGAALAGLTLVTVNPASRPDELRFVLEQSKAAGLLYADNYRGTSMAETAQLVAPVVATLQHSLPLSDWRSIANCHGGTDLPEVVSTDPAQIQFTSGTTGRPKGVLLTHHAIANNPRLSTARVGATRDSAWLNTLPMFHTAACVTMTLGPLWRHARHVMVGRPDPGLILELIEAEQVEVIGAVPTVLIGLLEHPEFKHRDLSSLKLVMSGGTIVPVELIHRIESELRVDLTNLYGQTELSPVVAATSRTDSVDDKANTVGQPLPCNECAVLDVNDGSVVPIGQQGEICVRGYQRMAGYDGLPEETAATIDNQGWLHTGDMGVMDERGYLRITGRLKEMIIRGGENIYPREVEERLYAHPAVGEVAVIGVPDDLLGERVAAVIRFRDGAAAPDRASLRAWCKESLNPQKVPTDWFAVDAFPATTSGKIQKHLLRQHATEGRLTMLQ